MLTTDPKKKALKVIRRPTTIAGHRKVSAGGQSYCGASAACFEVLFPALLPRPSSCFNARCSHRLHEECTKQEQGFHQNLMTPCRCSPSGSRQRRRRRLSGRRARKKWPAAPPLWTRMLCGPCAAHVVVEPQRLCAGGLLPSSPSSASCALPAQTCSREHHEVDTAGTVRRRSARP